MEDWLACFANRVVQWLDSSGAHGAKCGLVSAVPLLRSDPRVENGCLSRSLKSASEIGLSGQLSGMKRLRMGFLLP